jgi:tyrosyl-tRNA synthetase
MAPQCDRQGLPTASQARSELTDVGFRSERGPVTDAILDDLAARKLVADGTDPLELRRRLLEGPITLYAGFDPTADSLHVGNLVPLLLLRRFQEAGHRPIAVSGGATGMIGDPGGRSEERNLLDDATLDRNLAAIRAQLAQFVDLDGDRGLLVDNRSWTQPLGVLEFLRDVGKHMTVNAMLAKESVRSRVESESGISYTEFSYMLLQANDFDVLHRTHGCELQVGGSDQWGNITAGIDLIRRRRGARVHGLTVPLITRADGAKFGKSVDGSVWLSPERTSPYAFYQYWINVDDRDVERFLLQLTLLAVPEVASLVAAHVAAPERRLGQRRLAQEMTGLVHGTDAALAAEAASAVLFGGDPAVADRAALEMLGLELGVAGLERGELDGGLAVDVLLRRTGLATSGSDARRGLEAGEVQVNGRRVALGDQVGAAELLHGRYLLVRRTKKKYALAEVGEAASGC